MKTTYLAVSLGALLSVAAALGQPQQAAGAGAPQSQSAQAGQSNPLYRITVTARTTKAINYRHASGPTPVDFKGTVLAPFTKGQARVDSKKGVVDISAKFDKLQPANQYGQQFLTYVLWAITPEGRASNLGELVLDGTKSKLDAATEFQAFAMIVTAEPYFAVNQPSEVVVMENIVRPDTEGNVEEIDAKFDLLQRGEYSTISPDQNAPNLDSRIPLSLYEARYAVQIAKAAGAEQYAAPSFQKAQQLLQQAEASQTSKAPRKTIDMSAREAVQTAEDARSITMKRLEEERQGTERKAAEGREALAKQQAADAEKAKLEAQLAAEHAARDKADAEAARASALVQQQEAEKAAQLAAQQKAAAEAETEKAKQATAQAESEKAELRARLLNQLNMVLQTRDTARGLIVNMSDVLFDTASYTLKPGAREKLAKISGILLAYPALKVQVEGHTDSVGGDEFNQRLSEQRAGSVREYLMGQGVQSGSITAQGFGKTQPVASNDTPEGRQQNRRVELVVNGDSIGESADPAPPATSPQR